MGRVEFNKLNTKLQQLIIQKGKSLPSFDVDKYLNPTLDDMFDPFKLNGMKEATERINKAILNNEKIVIKAEYDKKARAEGYECRRFSSDV